MTLDEHLTLSWTQIQPNKPTPSGASATGPCGRIGHGVSLVQDRLLVLFGGNSSSSSESNMNQVVPCDPSQACWALDNVGSRVQGSDAEGVLKPSSNLRWRKIHLCAHKKNTSDKDKDVNCACCPRVRLGHGQAIDESQSDSKHIYIFGGRDVDGNVLSDLWVLDCTAEGQEKWKRIDYNDYSDTAHETESVIPDGRMFARMVCLQEQLYVFGGYDKNKVKQNSLLRFDLKTRAWTNQGEPTKLVTSTRCYENAFGIPMVDYDLMVLGSKRKLGLAVEGYMDGQRYKIQEQQWVERLDGLKQRTPRLYGPISAVFPSAGITLVFAGTDEKASHARDVVVLDQDKGSYLVSLHAPDTGSAHLQPWPEGRQCPSCASRDLLQGRGVLYLFGGYRNAKADGADDEGTSGFLNDLWKLDFVDEDHDDFMDLDNIRRAT